MEPSSVRILSASAGSGKTFRLAAEYIRILIDDPSAYRTVLAVTFTNKATAEMKSRILTLLGALADGKGPLMEMMVRQTGLSEGIVAQRAGTALSRILHDFSGFSILTIDRFFQRILRNFLREIGIDGNFTLEINGQDLTGEAIDRLISDIPDDRTLRSWLMDMLSDNLSESRSWDIRAAISEQAGVLLDRYPGSVRPDAQNPERLREILGRTARRFAQKREIVRESLRRDGERFAEILGKVGLSAMDLLYGSGGVGGFMSSLAKGEVKEPGKRVTSAIDEGKWISKPLQSTIEPVVTELEETVRAAVARTRIFLGREATLRIFRKRFRTFAVMSELRSRLESICSEKRTVRLSDVSAILSDLISDNDAPFIYEKTGSRFDHFMIDEFQDTSTAQWENFLPLLRNAASQRNGSVMLIGDVKQSIYRWRDGDWTLLAEKAQRAFPQSSSTERLRTNWRSRQTVVEFCNAMTGALLRAVGRIDDGKLSETLKTGSISGSFAERMNGQLEQAYGDFRQIPSDKSGKGYVTIAECSVPAGAADRDAEESEILARVHGLLDRGFRPCDIAVMVRKNKQVADVARLLLAGRREGDTYSIVTQEGLYIGSSETCRFIAAMMQLSQRPDDVLSTAAARMFLGQSPGSPLSEEDMAFIRDISMRSPMEAFHAIVGRYGLAGRSGDLAYIQAMESQIMAYGRTRISDIAGFLEWWNSKGVEESVMLPESESSLTVCTVHKSKGLEYPAVVLPYLTWGMDPNNDTVIWSDRLEGEGIPWYPISSGSDAEKSAFAQSAVQEKLSHDMDVMNMMYVAMTRAVEELHLILPAGSSQKKLAGIILDILKCPQDAESVQLDDVRLDISHPGDGVRMYSLGTPSQYVPRKGTPEETIHAPGDCFPIREKISVRREPEDTCGKELTRRGYGILMHRVFENARTMEDIEKAVEGLRQDGVISQSEEQELRARISDAFSDGPAGEWFSDSWDRILCEEEILSKDGRLFRPDRVMIRGNRAVVVDYKFGELFQQRYWLQVLTYMGLLRDMGYSQTEGYVWSVLRDTVTPVRIDAAAIGELGLE